MKILSSLHKKSSTLFTKYIYIIKSGIYFKIGNTRNLHTRLLYYKTHNPHELILLDYTPSEDYSNFEFKVKSKYKDKIHRGEWFLLSKSDVKAIQKEWFS